MTDAVLTRTAVRKYQDQSLTDEQLEKLVEAGTFNELTEKRGAFFELTKKMRGERHV